MTTKRMGLEGFLGHTTNAPRAGVLRDWKKRDEHSIKVWLHQDEPFQCIWRHNLARLVRRDDKVEVWGAQFVCHEDEDTSKHQFRRNSDGDRQYPPASCPICKMLEWLYQHAGIPTKDECALGGDGMKRFAERCKRGGLIDWTAPIFRFEGDDPDKSQVFHLCGLVGLAGRKEMPEHEAKHLRDHGIWRKDVWKENANAKAAYVMCVVDDGNPDDGAQVMVEPGLLGDKLRVEIAKELKRRGREDGDPIRNPYPFAFEFDPRDNIEFGKKYDVTALTDKPTEQVLALIGGPAPDTRHVTDRFDPARARASLEAHCLVKLPWDDWFPPAAAQQEIEEVGRRDERPKDAPPAPADEPEGEMVACDDCGKPMLLTAPKCPSCGKVYEEEPTPAPPPLRSRSQVKAAKAASKPTPKPQASEFDAPESGGDDGDVPF